MDQGVRVWVRNADVAWTPGKKRKLCRGVSIQVIIILTNEIVEFIGGCHQLRSYPGQNWYATASRGENQCVRSNGR